MTYYHSSITHTSSIQVITSSIFTLFNNVLGSAGYTFIETLDITSGSWIIFKNSSANNSRLDYHIGIRAQIFDGFPQYHQVGMALFEDWNTSSKTAIRYAPFSAAANGTNWAVDSPAYLPNSQTNPSIFLATVIIASGSNFNVWAKKELVAFSTTCVQSLQSPATDYFKPIVAGLYNSFATGSNDPAPLFIFSTATGNYFLGTAFTSLPEFTYTDGRATRAALRTTFDAFHTILVPLTRPSWIANAFTKQFLFSKAAVVNLRSSSETQYKFPRAVRGICPDLFYGSNSSGVNLQTQWTLAGSTYYVRNLSAGTYDYFIQGYGGLNGENCDMRNCLLILE